MTEARRKQITGLLALLTVSLLLLLPKAVHAAKVTESGTCGEGLEWKLTDDGVLTISGSGIIQKSTWPSSGITKVVIKSGVTGIGGNALEGLPMKSVVIPGSVKDIDHCAFFGCSLLESVSFPSGLETVGSQAFHYCYALGSVSISDTVRSIAGDAFLCCFDFSKIILNSGNPYYSIEGGILYDKEKTRLLLCPPLAVSGSLTIPRSVKEIGECAFWQCDKITSIQLPDGLIKIEDEAFHFCQGMTEINIPDTVNSIGMRAFICCDKLQTVRIPASVYKIGREAFYLCTGISAFSVDEDNPYYCSQDGVLFNKQKTILVYYPSEKKDASYQIPAGVRYLDNNAFYCNLSLVSISIPRSVIEIYNDRSYSSDEEQFEILSNLKEFIVESENTEFASKSGVLFSKDMRKLLHYPRGKQGAYVIPSGVNEIKKDTFSGCSGLTGITIPEGVTSIPYGAFSGTSLTGVTIPDGVTVIESFAFSRCSLLKSITIPDSVTKIEDYAFSYSSNLQHVYYGGTRKEWAEVNIETTSNESLLAATLHPISPTFTLPKSLVRIEEEAFANVRKGIFRIPEKVTYIAENAFSDDAVILCSEGSYAESRCRSLGLKVKTE